MCESCSNSDFVHLHNHTHYSVQDALPRPKGLAMRARQMGFPAVAMTDLGRMGGWIEFYKACKDESEDLPPIKPICGCEVYVVPDRFDKTPIILETGAKRRPKSWHLTLLAQNEEGYRNLLAMSSIGAEEGYYYEPRIDWSVIESHSAGVIALSGCLGSEVNQHLLREDEESAEAVLRRYKDLFGDRYWGELQYHGIEAQKLIMPKLRGLCGKLDIPMVASNDVHYLSEDDWELHDVLINMRNTRDDTGDEKIENGKRKAYATKQFFLKEAAAMHKIFERLQPDALINTRRLAESVEDFFTLNVQHKLPNAHIPSDDPEFQAFYRRFYPYNQPKEAYLAYLAVKGLKARKLDTQRAYRDRLNYELKVIWHMDVTDYFLVQNEIVGFMKQQGIMYGIRGSGVGCLVNYCLGISSEDPIRWNLMFERFLNPGRGTQYKVTFNERSSKEYLKEQGMVAQENAVARLQTLAKDHLSNEPGLVKHGPDISKEIWVLENQHLATYICELADQGFKSEKNEPQLWSAYFLGITNERPSQGMIVSKIATLPDIDTDIDDRYRGALISWAKQRYGDDSVAMIGAWGTYNIKAAVTGCLKMSDKFRADNANPHLAAQYISKLIPVMPQSAEPSDDPIRDACEASEEFAHYARKYPKEMDAARRLIGTISNLSVHAAGVVISNEPISQHTPMEKSNKGVVTAYDMDHIETTGLVKFDFLGVAMYQKLARAIELVEDRHGVKVVLDEIPFDDDKILSLYRTGKTSTLFQFASTGMQKTLREVVPTDVEDLIAVAALYRPGPMEFISEYGEGKRHPEKVRYEHPIIEKHLGVTYNIPVYQEQLMYICKEMAHFNWLEVDDMRKSVSKKDPEKFKKVCAVFRRKCGERGIDVKLVDEIIERWKRFAGYAFNRSHSCKYSILSYHTGFFRAYYPHEWFAACIQADLDNGTKSALDRIPLVRRECAMERITVVDADVNVSRDVAYVSDSGQVVMPLSSVKNVGEAAHGVIASQPYESFKDFVFRSGANKLVIESLANEGALRSLPDIRKMSNLEEIIDLSEKYLKERRVLESAAAREAKGLKTVMPFERDDAVSALSRPTRAAGKPFQPKKSSVLDRALGGG